MNVLRARLSAALFGAVVALGLASAVNAAVIFTYTAVCTTDCDAIGLADGATVSATFGFTDSSVVPFAALDNSDVVSFSATIGDLTFDLGDLGVFGAFVPEPAALLLLVAGIGMMEFSRRRRAGV